MNPRPSNTAKLPALFNARSKASGPPIIQIIKKGIAAQVYMIV